MALDLGNPVRNLVGQPSYDKKPPPKKALTELLNALAQFHGTCWAPVEKVTNEHATQWRLMFNQCPGACGHVWSLVIKDENVARWLVSEINQRRNPRVL